MRKSLLFALLAMGTLSMSAQTSTKKYVTFQKAAENASVVKSGYNVSDKQKIATIDFSRITRADEEGGQPTNFINLYNLQYTSLTCFVSEIKGGETIAEGMLVPEVLSKRFAGNTLTSMAMGIPAQIKDITIFAIDKEGKILAQKKMTLDEAIAAGDGQSITLQDGTVIGYAAQLAFDEPIQLDGQPFYMGYQYTTDLKKAMNYSGKKVCVSFAINPCYFSNSHLESNDFTKGWMQDVSSNGCAYIVGVTEGNNGLRHNDMALINCSNARIVGGDDADFTLSYINLGTEDINDFDVTYNRGDGTKATYEDDAEGLPYGMIYYCNPYDEEVPTGRYHPTFTVSKVNGIADEYDGGDNTIQCRVIAMSEPQQMTAYIEEGTGTWCGWCPRGFIGMEYVEKNYDNVIVTQMHFGDEFTVGATFDAEGNITDLDREDYGYVAYVGYSNSGYPCAWINRGSFTDPYFGSYGDENGIPYEYGIKYDVEDQLAIPSEVALGTSSTLNGNQITVNTSAKFFINAAAGDYAIGYALTEDGLRGAQTNGYSGATADAYTQAFGSEPSAEISALFQQRSPYACTYNGVARKIYGIEGLEGSVGAIAGGGEVVNYNTTLEVPANVQDINNCHLITLVYDQETGEIVQAMKQKIGESNFEGVNTVIREGNGAALINATAGQVNIEGNGVASIYTVDGKLVSSQALNGAAAISLPAGNYVVRVNNGNDITVKKVNL